ncbi:MAG: cobyric acid synthase [Candidatus Puniceispirillaceae bacterium]
MLQGAGSNVGKSVLVAGLCRAFARRGLSVAPFKPQNMSNNAAVTKDGGEIGRAQALQARACYLAPVTDMNPVLLKPETDTGAQVIVQGKRFGSMRAREYGKQKAQLLPPVVESFDRLYEAHDLVIIEGAGSPAEVNLRAGDIANMGFAEAANVPVVMIGDIDRGGVIASLVGTDKVLSQDDRSRIKGFIINKFRGDTTLFHDGMTIIEEATNWRGVGILPWFGGASKLPAEDILDLSEKARAGEDKAVHVAVPVLRRIANFDDLDPLAAEDQVKLTLVGEGEALPGDADLILLPGSKATISDMAYIKEQGWDIDIKAHIRRGGHVIGLCGGYQMLGKMVYDPQGIEGANHQAEGLGLLDIETRLEGRKIVTDSQGVSVPEGLEVSGYEIHMGRTDGPDCARPMVMVNTKDGPVADGASDRTGRVRGCYMHGLFASDSYRAHLLALLGGEARTVDFDDVIEQELDRLADHIEAHLDLEALADIAGIDLEGYANQKA